jgi:hypothetical protein
MRFDCLRYVYNDRFQSLPDYLVEEAEYRWLFCMFPFPLRESHPLLLRSPHPHSCRTLCIVICLQWSQKRSMRLSCVFLQLTSRPVTTFIRFILLTRVRQWSKQSWTQIPTSHLLQQKRVLPVFLFSEHTLRLSFPLDGVLRMFHI